MQKELILYLTLIIEIYIPKKQLGRASGVPCKEFMSYKHLFKM